MLLLLFGGTSDKQLFVFDWWLKLGRVEISKGLEGCFNPNKILDWLSVDEEDFIVADATNVSIDAETGKNKKKKNKVETKYNKKY